MNLQARLTLYYVLLAVVMVGFISAVDLANDIKLQFDLTLERAESLRTLTAHGVELALNRQLDTPVEEAVRDPELATLLGDAMLASGAILEIAVVDPQGVILAGSAPDHRGEGLPRYDDFRPVVTRTNWYQKLRKLTGNRYYQLEQPLGPSGGPPVVYVRVIVDPTLIRADILPRLRESALAAALLLGGAVALTFLFSAVAFRPVGRLRKQLDLLASGEYAETPAAAKPAHDDFSIMASKVSLLGERLRGAQFEVSDLRGNIDRLLRDLEDAVFLFNREGRLVFASGSVEKLLGRERGELAGQPMEAVFPPATKAGLLMAQAAETGRTVRNRRAEAGAGEVLLSVDALERAPGGGRSGVLVRLRDPEAHRQIGRELRMADRLAALSRVSGGVAHEVKNPLNAILLHVEVARAKVAHGDTEIEPQMDIIAREILRLDRVVKTFLDFTRPVELKLSEVPLEELLNEVAELARPQAEARQIRLAVNVEDEGGGVRVDRDLLKQAILNIVVNAMEAMPGGGELRLESVARGETAEIRVVDTGPGIPAELREKIFKLYFTTKKEGSGIGLAMTFRIVQLHDGTIDFTSQPGKGTTFVIQLPLVA